MAPPNRHHSARKHKILQLAERLAPERDQWIARNEYYYAQDFSYMRFLVPRGSRILDIGCGSGALLHALNPSHGVGVDFSPNMIAAAKARHPEFTYVIGDAEYADTYKDLSGPFDFIILSDTIGSLDDCETTLAHLHKVCDRDTRIIISYYSKIWEPILNIAELLGLKMPQVLQNWLSIDDIANFLHLSDYEVVKREWRQLIPRRLLGIGSFFNRYIAPFPIIRRACLRNYVVARSLRHTSHEALSTTVMIPCRNERGNIAAAIERLPRFCADIEILFVEGHSQDGTLEEIHRVITAHPELDIKVLVQEGKGKGDAVRMGFSHARGDVLMILDADLTTPPEDLPKFYRALLSGKGEFINGSRLIYPMEQDAMRFLNYLANHAFSRLFSWLLNQRFTDTLCGTKVLTKYHYKQIEANRAYFGEFDPFGDFDLIFGAAKLNLKVQEVPIRYAGRLYGETQISRFRHGLLLLRMVAFAFTKLKAF